MLIVEVLPLPFKISLLIRSMMNSFTLTIDWLAFTLPNMSVRNVVEKLGGDWTDIQKGFRGYPKCLIYRAAEGGVGKLGTGALRDPMEVHVDLSGGIVSSWAPDFLKKILLWIFSRKGHITRLDCAFDDRKNLVPLSHVKQALDNGQIVTRAGQGKKLETFLVGNAETTGESIYFGSRLSQTKLRVYDKRAEQRSKQKENWEDYGIRWELELKEKRAQSFAKVLAELPQVDWLEYAVGILRSFINFRDTTHEAPTYERSRAPLLPWWVELTAGFGRGQLYIEKRERDLGKVRAWVVQSLTPLLSVLCADPKTGQEWLEKVIARGPDRWKSKHYQLLGLQPPNHKFLGDG